MRCISWKFLFNTNHSYFSRFSHVDDMTSFTVTKLAMTRERRLRAVSCSSFKPQKIESTTVRGERRSREERGRKLERRKKWENPFCSLRPNLSSFVPLICIVFWIFCSPRVALRKGGRTHGLLHGTGKVHFLGVSSPGLREWRIGRRKARFNFQFSL